MLSYLLGQVYNLFAKGGSTGGVIVRQPGGTPGTSEAQLYHDGTNVHILNKSGGSISFDQTSGLFAPAGGSAALGAIGNSWSYLELTGTSFFVIRANNDTYFSRIAALVWASSWTNGTGKGWLQNSAARARNTADVTNATATMSNLSDLSITLISGRKYTGRMVLKCNNSVAADGIQIDFNGGTATMTSFWAGAGVLASGGTDTIGTNTSTSLAGVINFTVLTGETVLVVEYSGVCNAGGTFIPRFAENAHTTGTATVELGSYLFIEDSPN